MKNILHGEKDIMILMKHLAKNFRIFMKPLIVIPPDIYNLDVLLKILRDGIGLTDSKIFPIVPNLILIITRTGTTTITYMTVKNNSKI